MTKFEEELNKYNIFDRTVYLEGGPKEILIAHFKNWHSDEEFGKLRDDLDCANERVELLENTVEELNQQALPVVPECVGKYIKTKLDKSKNLQDLYDEPLFHTGEAYLSGSEYNFISWFNENTTLFEKAWTNGYTVEKPQLFYLKNKITGLNLVLEQSFNATGKHVGERFREFDMQYIATDEQEARLYKNTFSKAEIKNMDAGSYEQIKVEEKNEL